VRWARKATDLGYEVAGLPSLSRRVSALFSVVHSAVLFAMQAMRIET
jgi:hypothetical protein